MLIDAVKHIVIITAPQQTRETYSCRGACLSEDVFTHPVSGADSKLKAAEIQVNPKPEAPIAGLLLTQEVTRFLCQ
jgi:hypothetical protein